MNLGLIFYTLCFDTSARMSLCVKCSLIKFNVEGELLYVTLGHATSRQARLQGTVQ